MLKFLAGLLFGTAMSLAYVHWHWQLPAVLQVPELVQRGVVAGAVGESLYDLESPLTQRRRALEIYFGTQPREAVEIDGTAGHPFLNLLYRRRVSREARQLLHARTAHRASLEKPALRQVLTRKHATDDEQVLLLRMLESALKEKEFLYSWMMKNRIAISGPALLDELRRLALAPAPAAAR